MPRRTGQFALSLPAPPRWGGPRPGAGRKPTRVTAGLPHARRDALGGRCPVHLTLRARPGLPSLRGPPCWRVVVTALRAVAARRDFAIVHLSIQRTHLT